MRYKEIYILPLLVLAALFGFSACSSEDDITDGQTELTGGDVIVKAGIGKGSIFTRSNPIGTIEEQKQFNAGDVILIYDEAKKRSVYKLDAQGAWNFYDPKVSWDHSQTYFTANPMKWDANEKTFYAAYPVEDKRWDGAERKNWYQGDNEYNSVYISDQSTLKDLVRADVMYAKTVVSEKPKDNTISLNFERQTARVIVKLKYNGQFDGLNPTVDNLQIYCDYALTSYGSTWWNAVTPYYNSANNEYVALLFPMTADASKKFMELTLNHDADADGKTSTDLTLTGTPALEKGKSYTFNVLVGKEKLSIESVTVSDWQNEKVIDGGSLEVNPLASATTEDVGKVVTAEGNLFATTAAARAAGETPIAMVAYVGSETGSAYNHGLAIAIGNAASADTTQYGEETSLDNVQTALSAFAAKNKTPNQTGSWQIPSVDNLERIFYSVVLDGLKDADEEYIDQVKEEWETIFANGVQKSQDDFSVSCGSFVNKMTDCGGKAFLQVEFQSATGQDESVAWGGILTSDYSDSGKPYLYVTSVEAFKTFQRVVRGENDHETQSFVIRPIFAF